MTADEKVKLWCILAAGVAATVDSDTTPEDKWVVQGADKLMGDAMSRYAIWRKNEMAAESSRANP